MKKLTLLLLLISGFTFAQQPGTLLNPAAINGYTTNGKVLMTKTSGTITGVPTWTNTIPYSMITGTPAITVPTLQQVTDAGATTTVTITSPEFNTTNARASVYDNGAMFRDNSFFDLFEVDGIIGIVKYKTNEIISTISTNTLTNKTYSNSILSGSVNVTGSTANRLTYYNGSKNLASVTLGSGLTLSSGTLSATGSGSTTILTASTNITISGTAPNYTISTPTQTTVLGASVTALSASVAAIVDHDKYMWLDVADSPTLTGTTANTILSTYSFTANEYMVGDVIRFFVKGRSVGTASFKTIRLYYNTTASLTGATLLSSNQVANTNISFSNIKNGTIKSATRTEFFSSATASDEGVANNQASTDINIDYTIPGYFMVAVINNSSADATVISLFEVQRKRL